MEATTPGSGSAERWGPLWGHRATDWAANEEQQIHTYVAALERVEPEPGQRVLDLGCGSGVFLREAADRGAEVAGLDASPELIAIARNRVPEADLRVGDMQFLPFADDEFDLVTGFNSFFFAADMVAALREAGRVARPGGSVLIQVWGRPERCELEATKALARPYISGSAGGGDGGGKGEAKSAPPPLWKPGVLEAMAEEAGLTPGASFDSTWSYEYADEEALARGMLSPAGLARLAGEREPELRAAIIDALEPHRGPDGAYRLSNEFHYLLAGA